MNRQSICFVLLVGAWLAAPSFAATLAEIALMPEGGHATSDAVVILSTTDLTAAPDFKSFQIRDATRAITIYGTTAQVDATLAGFGVGDVIDISGDTAKRDGAIVLVTGSVGGFAVSGRTSTAPLLTNAVVVSPSDIAASFESNLVCLQNVEFASTGHFTAGLDYALTNGTAIRIATDDLGLTGLAIPAGPVNITGIVIPGDSVSSDAGYRLAPRGPADIAPIPEPSALVLLGAGGAVMLSLAGCRRRRLRGFLAADGFRGGFPS